MRNVKLQENQIVYFINLNNPNKPIEKCKVDKFCDGTFYLQSLENKNLTFNLFKNCEKFFYQTKKEALFYYNLIFKNE